VVRLRLSFIIIYFLKRELLRDAHFCSFSLHSKTKMAKQSQHHGRAWYVLHTYSGYEDNVARNLKQRIESMDMQEHIFDVMVPIEKKIKIKSGKRTVVEEKIYPGYVLVNMVVTDASWYVVRNTPNVTGFIGLGTTPTPVDPREIELLKKRMGVAEPKYKIDVKIGDSVKIVDGPFKEFDGKVDEVDEEKGRVKVLVSIFGRETPVELDFLQINKI
jgi:transcription termination/antitermination protein NusG